MRFLLNFHDIECRLFKKVNRYYEKKYLNLFFRTVTNFGGAAFLIVVLLMLITFPSYQIKMAAISSALALTLSHIPVQIVKKIYPRQRPYIILENTNIVSNPLKDHSFPSGHTTAIFSVIIPFILLIPILSFVLIPLGLLVGISRIYLGLHYPTDVMAGGVLGLSFGCLCYYSLSI